MPLTVLKKNEMKLKGMYVRNGPNPEIKKQKRYHIFDGDGMLHFVKFDEHISYQNIQAPT